MTFDSNDKKIIDYFFMNVLKEGLIFRSYQQFLKPKVFGFENGVTLLIISGIPIFRCEVQATRQGIWFPLLSP
jgi:hypothetical protein